MYPSRCVRVCVSLWCWHVRGVCECVWWWIMLVATHPRQQPHTGSGRKRSWCVAEFLPMASEYCIKKTHINYNAVFLFSETLKSSIYIGVPVSLSYLLPSWHFSGENYTLWSFPLIQSFFIFTCNCDGRCCVAPSYHTLLSRVIETVAFTVISHSLRFTIPLHIFPITSISETGL